MGETKVQGCEEKEKVLLLWENALTLLYENDLDLFTAKAQERTIAGKIAMYMDRAYPKFFQMPGLVIDIEYNRSGENRKPNNLSIKERSWTAPDIVLHKRLTDDYNIFCCEMKKNSDSGKYDARKVRSLIRHRQYKYGIDLYKINEDGVKFTLYYLRENHKRYEKEEYIFNLNSNRIVQVKAESIKE